MDFLDPQKQKAHSRRLFVGYALLGVLLLLATVVLMYQAYGFGVDRSGRVIQNGLVFFSSQPSGAKVYLNGTEKDTTNTRLILPAGAYTMELQRSGYRTWKRALTVEGGSVERFDYPFLFPNTLKTTTIKQYPVAPVMSTQSPDRRWLLVQADAADTFDLWDTTAKTPAARPLAIPSDLYTAGTTTKTWTAISWSTDNRHVLLRRTYDKAGQLGSEYIMLDREDPTKSQNLSILLGLTPTTIELVDGKYDQYYLYDQTAQQLLTATLKKPTPQPLIKDVLTLAADEDGMLVYVTPDPAHADKVLVRLRQDDATYTVRQLPAGSTYLVDLAQYDGVWFVAAGAQSENKVYVYSDPIGLLKSSQVPAPVQVLKVTAPSYVSFSKNARFVVAENADHFAVYDAETDKGYAYQLKNTLDTPQAHATWMDGFRLQVVSGGKLTVCDFDGANMQSLIAMSPATLPFFDRDYRSVYAFTAQNALSSTALLTPQDQ